DGGISLVLNETERVRAVDVQTDAGCRQVGNRVIEYVLSVQLDLKALPFEDSHSLAHRCVETPLAWQFQSLSAQRASRSRLRILQQNLSGLRIRHRLQSAKRFQCVRNKSALRIRNLAKAISEEIAEIAVPLNLTEVLHRKWSDDIRY